MPNYQEQLIMELRLRGYSKDTERSYVYHVSRFESYFDQSLELLDESHVRSYLLYLKNSSISFSFINTSYSAIKFLFTYVFHRGWDVNNIPRPRKVTKLPKYLSFEEVISIINATSNIKHKAILSTIYSAGLRVSEVVNLKISDIDSSNMQIFVSQGKGNKDRYTILSKHNLALLRKYYRIYSPSEYLFPNERTNLPLSARTVQQAFKDSLLAANVNKDVSVHSLRHSFATHLLLNGVDVYYIQQLLGHSNIETTAVYLHLVSKELNNVVSPLDSFFDGSLV